MVVVIVCARRAVPAHGDRRLRARAACAHRPSLIDAARNSLRRQASLRHRKREQSERRGSRGPGRARIAAANVVRLPDVSDAEDGDVSEAAQGSGSGTKAAAPKKDMRRIQTDVPRPRQGRLVMWEVEFGERGCAGALFAADEATERRVRLLRSYVLQLACPGRNECALPIIAADSDADADADAPGRSAVASDRIRRHASSSGPLSFRAELDVTSSSALSLSSRCVASGVGNSPADLAIALTSNVMRQVTARRGADVRPEELQLVEYARLSPSDSFGEVRGGDRGGGLQRIKLAWSAECRCRCPPIISGRPVATTTESYEWLQYKDHDHCMQLELFEGSSRTGSAVAITTMEVVEIPRRELLQRADPAERLRIEKLVSEAGWFAQGCSLPVLFELHPMIWLSLTLLSILSPLRPVRLSGMTTGSWSSCTGRSARGSSSGHAWWRTCCGTRTTTAKHGTGRRTPTARETARRMARMPHC